MQKINTCNDNDTCNFINPEKNKFSEHLHVLKEIKLETSVCYIIIVVYYQNYRIYY